MSLQIEKVNVMDAKFIQEQPRQNMMRGASSKAVVPIPPIGGAVQATQTKIQFNFPLTPSDFLDATPLLHLEWTIQVPIQNGGAYASGGASATTSGPLVPGVDVSIAPYPIAQILKDCDLSFNGKKIASFDVGKLSNVLLRLQDSDNKYAVCPSKLETGFACVDDASLTLNNSNATFNDATDESIPNGSWSFTALACDNITVYGGGSPNGNATFSIACDMPLVGFDIFNWNMKDYKDAQALFGLSNLQLNLNIDLTRIHRCLRCSASSVTASAIAGTGGPGGIKIGKPFNLQLIPSGCSLKLYTMSQPEMSGFELPYPVYNKHFYDYYNNFIQCSNAFGAGVYTSNGSLRNISSTNMPSKIILWMDKDEQYYAQNYNKYFYPFTKLTMDLGTKQGIFSSWKTVDFFRASVDSGLKSTSYPVFQGQAYTVSFQADGTPNFANSAKQLVGAPIVLIPGVSFELPPDVSTGSYGNFVFNFDGACVIPTADNNHPDVVNTITPTLNVMFVYDKWLTVDTTNLAVDVVTANINPAEVISSSRAVESKDEVDEMEEGGVLSHFQHKKSPVRGGAFKQPSKLSMRLRK